MKRELLLIKIFSIIYIFFLFYNVKEIIRHPLYNPRSSKHFFEIFPNFIWESSQNIYYLDKPELLRKRNSLRKTSLKQSFLFQKNHDTLNLIITIIIKKIIKISLKKKELFEHLEKILKLINLLELRYSLFESKFYFFFIRKFCVKRGSS